MIEVEKVNYSDNETHFQGVVAWDNSINEKRPVILIAHAFGGQSKFDEDKAVALAKQGYIGFAIDVYGKGKRGSTPEESRELMGVLNNDRVLLLKRMQLSLEKAKTFEFADINKIGAIGFCFGGKCVLDLARSGVAVNGVVSFHGVYDKPNIQHEKDIEASVLVLHGWEDPLAPTEAVLELANELTERKADWTITAYGHTGHSFTNPKAQSRDTGMFFQKKSNLRAWQSMLNFFEEIFN